MQLFAGEVVGLRAIMVRKINLIKILSGTISPRMANCICRDTHNNSISQFARTHGIEVVYRIALCDHLTAAHNVLGKKKKWLGPLRILTTADVFQGRRNFCDAEI